MQKSKKTVGKSPMMMKNKNKKNYIRQMLSVRRSQKTQIQNRAPFRTPNFAPIKSDEPDPNRRKVKDTIIIFNQECEKLMEKTPTRSRSPYFYQEVAMSLKNHGQWLNANHIYIGTTVPGVRIGDRFHLRAELVIIGLHRQFLNGIDTTKYMGLTVATSIVDSNRYDNYYAENVLTYSGEGGLCPMSQDNRSPEDQKLVRGNLALVNSMKLKIPIRVIRVVSKDKNTNVYVYIGLYCVEDFHEVVGSSGKKVFKFNLRRVPVESDPGWLGKCGGITKKSVLVADISFGREKKPIPVLGSGSEKPDLFEYVTTTVSHPVHPQLLTGCECGVDGCSDPSLCTCAKRSIGARFAYDVKGRAIGGGGIVCECGTRCNCGASCRNRVSQKGVRVSLQVFGGEGVGWGVRCRDFIPVGGFVCEYAGEFICGEKGKELGGEYLVKLGEEGLGFWIDGRRMGNVGRFVKRSSGLGNLEGRRVLFDGGDGGMAHVMLFARRGIAPLTELTWDYEVR